MKEKINLIKYLKYYIELNSLIIERMKKIMILIMNYN